MSFFQGKKILITGGTGTIGRALIQDLLPEQPEVIRIFSRDEFKQFELQTEYPGVRSLRFLLGDVRDYDRLRRALEDIDFVFHTAAMKHVPACEYNPFEAVQTNVTGTQNLINAAKEMGIKRVVLTSTDKAINPTNTMGATKLMAERLIAAAEYQKGSSHTVLSAVRFGNVMGSRGSVIPLFVKQIREQRKITLTAPEMTRFMMTITEATHLTKEAMRIAAGGEVFVFKMPVVRLIDLAKAVISLTCEKYGLAEKTIGIETIGLRPGEKMYEELMTSEEAKTAYELENMFAIPSQFVNKKYDYAPASQAGIARYSSADEQVVGDEELRTLILRSNVI